MEKFSSKLLVLVKTNFIKIVFISCHIVMTMQCHKDHFRDIKVKPMLLYEKSSLILIHMKEAILSIKTMEFQGILLQPFLSGNIKTVDALGQKFTTSPIGI